MKIFRIFTFIVAALLCGNASAQTLTVGEVSIEPNGEATIAISVAAETVQCATNFTITLPDGITADTSDKSKCSGELIDDHTLDITPNDAGSEVDVIIYSSNISNFKAVSGVVFNLPIKAGDIEAGTLKGTISNITVSDADENENSPEDFEFDITVEAAEVPFVKPDPLEGTLINMVDYADPKDETGASANRYPFYFDNNWKSAASSMEWKQNALNITNPEAGNFMLMITDWMSLKESYTYNVRVFYKSTAAGTVNFVLGSWSNSASKNDVEIEACDTWKELVIPFESIGFEVNDNSAHVLLHCGGIVGTLSIRMVEIYEIAPATPPAPKNWYTIFEADGTFTDLFAVKYFKNYVAATSEGGAIVVESLDPDKTYTEYYMEDGDGNAVDAKLANDWDTQFLITLPFVVPKNTNMKFSMKYWADKAAKANTQAHSAPEVGLVESKGTGAFPEYAGTYIHYALMGDVNFPEAEDTFEAEFKVPADGMQAICFNLECLREVNKYYFDDIKVQIELTEDDYTTGVIPVSVKKVQKGVRYNLAGQKVDENYKGLVIENGKKFFNK